MSEKPMSVADYAAKREQENRPRRVAELSELEKAQLGPERVRAMLDSEQAQDAIAAKHKAAAEAAAQARAVVAKLPSWIAPRALGWDHKGQRVEIEADNPPMPLSDGRVLLRLTRRKPRPTPGTFGNVPVALSKLGADSQSLEPAEARWLACGGLIRVPSNKSVVVWCLHRPHGVAVSSEDLTKGYTLDAPRQFSSGYSGEMTIHFVNGPERNLLLSPGHYVALAELVDS
ncbi:MAG TPA: hypothetical protein PLW65_04515 [Pseudomonadota bacterium]|nr:hypothetical protein [Pseudomonadota bacterium]